MAHRLSDTLEAIRQARHHLTELERLAPQLHELHRQAAPGYSPHTDHAIGSRGGTSDPTGQAAVISDSDPVRQAWRQTATDILNARNRLRAAVSEALDHIDPHTPDLDPTVWCEHCLDHGIHTPAEQHRVLCPACRTYWHRHGQRRPRHLVIADQ